MQFKAQEKEAMMQERYDIYSFKTSLFDTYKRRKKNNVVVPIFKQYQKEMLTILLPDIKVEYLDFLIKNNICSVYITFSGIRVTRFVNIFFNYDFPDHIPHPRLECLEEKILDRLVELDKFIMSKNINESYKENIKCFRTIFIEFKDPYHKKLVIDNLLTVDDMDGTVDPDYFIKTYPETLEISTRIQVSIEGNFLKPYNRDEFIGLTIDCSREHIFDSLEALDKDIHFSQALPKLNIPLIVSFDLDDQIEDQTENEIEIIQNGKDLILKTQGFQGEYDDPEIIYMVSKKDNKDAYLNMSSKTNEELREYAQGIIKKSNKKQNELNIELDTIEKIVDNITPFNTKQIIRTFNEKYKIVPHDIEVAVVKQEYTGLDLLKEFYLYDNQLKTIFETYLPDIKWNGKFDEDSIKLLDTIPLLSNLIRFCSIDKFKPNLVFGMADGIKFINRNLLTTYLKEHCSREELYVLIKARNINPTIVKEISTNYYYSDYFKDVFKYFDIDYMHAYPSFFRFMINFIMQEEVVE